MLKGVEGPGVAKGPGGRVSKMRDQGGARRITDHRGAEEPINSKSKAKGGTMGLED